MAKTRHAATTVVAKKVTTSLDQSVKGLASGYHFPLNTRTDIGYKYQILSY